MRRKFRLLAAGIVLFAFAVPDPARAGSTQPFHVALVQPPSTEEFVPLNELPPEEQLPAAPLLIAAYVVVWFGLLGYVWTVWRRLRKVEQELAEIETRLSRPERTR